MVVLKIRIFLKKQEYQVEIIHYCTFKTAVSNALFSRNPESVGKLAAFKLYFQ